MRLNCGDRILRVIRWSSVGEAESSCRRCSFAETVRWYLGGIIVVECFTEWKAAQGCRRRIGNGTVLQTTSLRNAALQYIRAVLNKVVAC